MDSVQIGLGSEELSFLLAAGENHISPARDSTEALPAARSSLVKISSRRPSAEHPYGEASPGDPAPRANRSIDQAKLSSSDSFAGADDPAEANLPPPSFEARDSAGEPVTIQAHEQEKQGKVYRLSGDVEINFRKLVLRADEVTYNSSTGAVVAAGHVTIDGGPHDEHIAAARAEYNANTATGKFYEVVGTTGVRFRGRNVALTTSNPFAFTGKMVEKVSADRYIVHEGTVTSCELPHPKWVFNARTVVFDVGDKARIYNSSFRLKGVPILYFPYAAHPVEKLGRQSGFLIPSFGFSSRKGTIVGESVYVTMGRSMDAMAGAEFWSRRGWAQHADFRARPSQRSFVNLNYFGVLDRGSEAGPKDQGGRDIKLDAESLLPHDIRAVASINYLSSFVFRLAFTETFSQAINSEVQSSAFLSKNWNGFSFNARADRYQNFQSTAHGDLVTILHVPGFEVSGVDRKIGSLPAYWAFQASAEGVSRREPGFLTDNLVGRFDLHPRISLPLFLRGWSVRPEFGLWETYYTQERIPVGGLGVPGKNPINRRAFDTSLELRPPVLSRVFSGKLFGREIKHTVQPRIIYRFVTGVDNFSQIIRFDARDIVSDTNEIEFRIVNRLFLKRGSQECLPAKEARNPQEAAPVNCSALPSDFISWELGQKYFFNEDFGGAIINGKRNVLTTSAGFTGIAFLTEPRKFSPVVSRLRVRTSANTDAQWHLDYDSKKGRINSSMVFINYHLGDFFLGGSHALLHAPGEIFVSSPIPGPSKFNQFRLLMGFGNPGRLGPSIAGNIGFDANLGFLQYSAVQTAYNWDCCGISVEYRRFALGSVRNENQLRFAFNLANIATAGNLKRQERIF